MKGPFYSVGPIKNVTLNAYNTTSFINEFRNTLLSANWSQVSAFTGSGGTPGYILRSYPTPFNLNRICIKIWWDGSFTIYPVVRFDISGSAGISFTNFGAVTISTDLGNKTLRCIAGPHQFFVFIDTSVPPNSNYNRQPQDYNNCMGGCPHVWELIPQDVYWGVGGNASFTFRNELRSLTAFGGNATFKINGIDPWTAAWPDGLGNTANCFPFLLSQRSIDLHSPIPMISGNYPVIEPYLVMGRTPNSYYAVNLWDAIVVGGRFSSKTLSVADFRIWESLTLSTSAEVPGCLFLVTSIGSNPDVGGFSY